MHEESSIVVLIRPSAEHFLVQCFSLMNTLWEPGRVKCLLKSSVGDQKMKAPKTAAPPESHGPQYEHHHHHHHKAEAEKKDEH